MSGLIGTFHDEAGTEVKVVTAPGTDEAHLASERARFRDAVLGSEGKNMTLEESLALIPDDWTRWELSSKGNKTRFRAELSRLANGDGDEEFAVGHAATPAEAVRMALEKVRGQ